MNSVYIKTATITPEVVLAGDSVEITIKIVAGPDFSAHGSRIVLDMPAYLGYTRPTMYNQEESGYIEVFCSNPDWYYEKGVWHMERREFVTSATVGTKNMAQRIFVVDLIEGEAKEGDEIEIKWGYTRDGFGVGTKIGTVVPEPVFMNTIHVRYFKDADRALPDLGRSFKGYDRPVPDVEIPVSYRILPRDPKRLRLITKTNYEVLQVLDGFSNICPNANLKNLCDDAPEANFNEFGMPKFEPGAGKISKTCLPYYETPSMSNVYKGCNIYFGDLHTHSVFSNDCIEREKMEQTPDRMFAFGRQVNGLDFMAITDHHQPWDIERNKIGRLGWEHLCDAVSKHTVPGSFIAFAGFEFRCVRGDTAIVLGETFSYDDIDRSEMKDIRFLWDAFRGRNYISIPHFHNGGKLPEGEWYTCPDESVEPVMEIYSCHGSYESSRVLERHVPLCKSWRDDRTAQYFLNNGAVYGITCNSDGHKGNPGWNGLTAVYATELTGDAILEAIRNRHVYGTTNARIKLLFTVNDHLMGSILQDTPNKTFHIAVCGERSFKAVDLIHNGTVVKRFYPNNIQFQTEWEFREEGKGYWYVRAIQIDNHIAYASPIWLR